MATSEQSPQHTVTTPEPNQKTMRHEERIVKEDTRIASKCTVPSYSYLSPPIRAPCLYLSSSRKIVHLVARTTILAGNACLLLLPDGLQILRGAGGTFGAINSLIIFTICSSTLTASTSNGRLFWCQLAARPSVLAVGTWSTAPDKIR